MPKYLGYILFQKTFKCVKGKWREDCWYSFVWLLVCQLNAQKQLPAFYRPYEVHVNCLVICEDKAQEGTTNCAFLLMSFSCINYAEVGCPAWAKLTCTQKAQNPRIIVPILFFRPASATWYQCLWISCTWLCLTFNWRERGFFFFYLFHVPYSGGEKN